MANRKKTNYLQKLLDVQNEHQRMMNEIVGKAIEEQESLIKKIYEDEQKIERTHGEKIADAVADFGGSWVFIIVFFVFLFIWMSYNSFMPKEGIFDPYPFILLNLLLSCLAAVQAPIILMTQNRKEARDRKRAQDDYLVNLKSELENRFIDQKLDLFINSQFKELIEIQKIQLTQLDSLERKVGHLVKAHKPKAEKAEPESFS